MIRFIQRTIQRLIHRLPCSARKWRRLKAVIRWDIERLEWRAPRRLHVSEWAFDPGALREVALMLGTRQIATLTCGRPAAR